MMMRVLIVRVMTYSFIRIIIIMMFILLIPWTLYNLILSQAGKTDKLWLVNLFSKTVIFSDSVNRILCNNNVESSQ